MLVRSVARAHPLLRVARNALKVLYGADNELIVTPQIVAEFWNVCTPPTKVNGLGNSIRKTDRLTSTLEDLFTVLPESIEVFREWRKLGVEQAVRGAKVHDALSRRGGISLPPGFHFDIQRR